MKSSRTGEDLYIMVNSVNRPLKRREIHRIYALSMQDLPSLMSFLGKESHQYPSSPTGINVVSILPGMECVISSPFQKHTIKIIIGVSFYIGLDSRWTKLKVT